MTDRTTRLKIEVDTKDLIKAEKQATKTFDALNAEDAADGFKELSFHLRGIGKLVGGLATDFRKFNAEMQKGGESEAFKGMADDIKAMTEAMTQFTKAKKASSDQDERDKAKQKQQAHRRGFAMGVMQGSGVGEYFPQEGLRANLAGRVLGGSLAAGPRALVGGMFHGSAGVAQGLQSVPGGGFIGGQIQNAMAAAQEALSYEQTKQSMLAFQGLRGVRGTAATAGTAAVPDRWLEPSGLSSEQQAQLTYNALNQRDVDLRIAGKAAAAMPADDFEEMMITAEGTAHQREQLLNKRSGKFFVKGSAAKKGRRASFTDEASWARSGGIAEEGTKFGLDKNEAMQMVSSLLQTSGGTIDQVTQQRAREMMGMSALGVGADVTGSFMRSARLGGSSGNAMDSAFRGAQGLGLQGSDLATSMRKMASVLMDFENTGMPIDVESVSNLAHAVAVTGVGGVRGSNIAQGLAGVGRQIGSGGPQDAAQFLMAKTMFGFKGGGADDFWQMMKNAESGDFSSGGGINALTESIRNGGGSASTKAMSVHQLFKSLGVQIGTKEAEMFASGKVDAGMEKKYGALLAGAQSVGGAADFAEGATSGALQQAAGTRNTRMGAGAKVLPAMLDFETATSNALKATTEFSGAINGAAALIKSFSEKLPQFAAETVDLLDQISKEVGIR